ncbi:MAG: YeeE/YedE family protein [Chloroflexota bacterium]|nr:MAG: YeeE/YedE family protein [Chloroflexota bacterium]
MEAVITGLFVGIFFGFVLQRGRFCMNSAFRDVLLLKDNTLLKAVGIALLVELFGFAIMDMTGAIAINPKPFWWGANILGSFVFGVGMVLAGGCASGITYRVGEGMIGAITAVLGLSIGGYITAAGFLKGFKSSLQEATIIKTADGANLTLANVLGMNYSTLALIIFVVAVVAWIIVARKNKEDYDGAAGWSWLSTGVLIGLAGIFAFPLSAAAGRNYPLGITAGWIGVVKNILGKAEGLDWLSWMVLGIMVGSFVAAMIAKEFKFRMPSVGDLLKTFGGGLLMGFGAVTSGGCNIGHLLSGVPQLSLGSILAGISIILGSWATSYLIFVRPNK